MTDLKNKKKFQNNVIILGLVAILVLVVVGVSQVILQRVRGDRAIATVSTNYLTQIGMSSVDSISNGGFDDSRKICQTVDGSCQEDGILDYTFDSSSEKTNLTAATGGGLILSREGDKFKENGVLTSKNYLTKSGKNISISKIQIGIGLKEGNLVSLGYSVDAGSNFTTAIGNFTYNQIKAQDNQTLIEYNLPTPVVVNQGFAYKIALKSDSSLLKSPSLKYVRVFYNVTSASSSTSGSTTSGSTGSTGGTTSTSGSTTSGTTSTTSGTTSTSGSTTSGSTGSTGGTTSTSGSTTSTSTSGASFLPLPSSSSGNSPQTPQNK